MSEEASILSVCQTKFRLKIANISKLDAVFSPIFDVQGIPWTVTVMKEGPHLEIYLNCNNTDETPDWKCTASAAMKLLTFDLNGSAYKMNIDPKIFVKDDSYCCGPFIGWADLFDTKNNYVQDDTIYLDIKVNVTDQAQSEESTLALVQVGLLCDESAKFRVTVTNIDKVTAVQSTKFLLGNLSFTFTLFRDALSHLSFRLEPDLFEDDDDSDDDDKASYQIKVSLKLISSKKEVYPVVINREETVDCANGECLEMYGFISFGQLFRFVVDNSISLDVDLQICESEVDHSVLNAKNKGVDIVEGGSTDCAICLKGFGYQKVSCPPCGHLFCSKCIKEAIKNRRTCPTCAAPGTLAELRRVFIPTLPRSNVKEAK